MKTIILAGGQSSRMGQNKALMKVAGERVIDRIVAELTPISDEVILIANEPAHYRNLGLKIYQDDPLFFAEGPLAGLYTGLTAAVEGACLVTACDMPFVSPRLAKILANKLIENKQEAVIPLTGEQMHPLFAVYDAGVAGRVKETLSEGKRSMKAFLDRIDVDFVSIDAEEKAVWNMNTMEEYKKVLEYVKGSEADVL